MKKITLFAGILLVFSSHLALAETVSLSTYYPAPFGTYDRLRLVPRDTIAGACKVGTLYTENVTNTLQYCAEVGGGPSAGAWGPMTGVWENDGSDNISLVGTDNPTSFRVGINDTTPDARLEVSGDGVGSDLLMVSSNDNTDGNFLTVKGDGKVGIGTTSPASTLDVNGTLTVQDGAFGDPAIQFSGTGEYLFSAAGRIEAVVDGTTAFSVHQNQIRPNRGTANAPGMAWSDDTNTGMYGPASNQIGFSTNGSEAMRIDNTGNVGIGTSNPVEKLDVDGSIRLRDNGTDWGKLMVEYSNGNYYAVYAP